MVACVNANRREDSAFDAVLEMYGLMMKGRNYE